MSLSGNKSSQSSSSNSTDYGTNVWGPQQPYITGLFGTANSMMGNTNIYQGGNEGYLNANDDSLKSEQMLQEAIKNMGLGGRGVESGYNVLDQSRNELTKFLNPGVNPAAQAYATRMGQDFNEQFLPGLKGDAMVAGGLGGSRQQIAAALGSDRAMQSISDLNANRYSEDMNRALTAAGGIGQLSSGYQANTAAANSISELAALISSGYQDAASGRLQQGAFQQGMPWYALNQYAGLLGSPIMQDLGSTSSSKGKGSSYGGSFGLGGG